MEIRDIFSSFDVYGDFVSAYPYGSGHINDTYAVECSQAGGRVRYILQRINCTIFTRPRELMDNISRVTEHCRQRLSTNGCDSSRQTLTVVKSNDGDNLFIDADGSYWRCYLFIENATTYDVPQSCEQIFQAAKAFGNFQNLLSDIKGEPLYETIPDFHNAPKRFDALQEAISADKCNRAACAKTEIDKINALSDVFYILPRLVKEGKIPIRITHNDTKINNVMIDDATGEGICVIDLDTVMPGLCLYDFGDIVRTTASPSAEDEKDLNKVNLDKSRFEAAAGGYLATAGGFLNKYEKENLVISGKLITLMIGVRFLTDYLNGDKYFKIKYPEHNLIRSRTQIKLVESINEQEESLESIIKQHG